MSLAPIRIPRMFAVVLVLAGLGFLMVGSVRQDITCTRAANTCTVEVGPPFLKSTHVIDLADVHGHEYRALPRRLGAWGVTVLRIRHDHELAIAPAPEATAREDHAAIVAFLGGTGDTLEIHSPVWLPFISLGLALILAAPVPYWIFRRLWPARPAIDEEM